MSEKTAASLGDANMVVDTRVVAAREGRAVSFWSKHPGALERASEMWNIQGLTARTIATALGTTASTVTSQARHQNWTMRGSPIKAALGINKRKHIRSLLRAAPQPIRDAVLMTPFKRCQWLDGHRPFTQCKATPDTGRPYCHEHCLRAYEKYPGPRAST